jgi:hypothetical protein
MDTKPIPLERALRRPYEVFYFATTASRWRRFLRTFIPWQIVRFVLINLRMLRMIGKSHR